MKKGSGFKIEHHPLVRILIYYLALIVVGWAMWTALPPAVEEFVRTALGPLLGTKSVAASSGMDVVLSTPKEIPALPPAYVAIMTLFAGAAAFALALPVSWVYMFTRQKKGYSQSVVQALVLMPVVIAVIAGLVRNSVGLAFSLAGIFAAVRFRTTLDDSKDAVFMFVVSVLGLACGVQLEVAAVLSLMFVVLTLGVWFTDFARVPPGLEGAMAERRLERAKSIVNRTSQFVAQLDHEVIEGMAPQQLESLASKIERRRRELNVEPNDEEAGPRFDGRIRVTVTDSDAAKQIVEGVLQNESKRWKMVRVDQKDGSAELVYAVRLRKGYELATLKEAVIRDGVPYVVSAEVGAWL